MFEAKETIITWKGQVLFILIDRRKPGKDYTIDYEQSRDGIDVYTKTGYPDKIFVKNVKTKELINAIYDRLRLKCL